MNYFRTLLGVVLFIPVVFVDAFFVHGLVTVGWNGVLAMARDLTGTGYNASLFIGYGVIATIYLVWTICTALSRE